MEHVTFRTVKRFYLKARANAFLSNPLIFLVKICIVGENLKVKAGAGNLGVQICADQRISTRNKQTVKALQIHQVSASLRADGECIAEASAAKADSALLCKGRRIFALAFPSRHHVFRILRIKTPVAVRWISVCLFG